MKNKKTSELDKEMINTISLADISLTSSVLSLDELIARLKSMLQDDTIKAYLELIKTKRICETPNYID